MDLGSFVNTNHDLARLCTQLENSRRLALDTEFERSRTFYVRPALVQISDGNNTYLVDPLTIDNWDPFIHLLNNSGITKIFHSASEDLDVIERLGGNPPDNLFDTQIAASMLGLGFSISYRALVQTLCNVDLPKSETRSNWLQRPLSNAQLEYASMDVAYLPSIYDQLHTRLLRQGRDGWVAEEYSRLVNRYHENQNPEHAYFRFQRTSKLGRRGLGVLRALAAWREHQARKRDLPRGFIVRDNQLLSIAKSQPNSITALEAVIGDGVKLHEHDASVVIRIIHRVMALKDSQLPHPLTAAGDLREHTQTIKTLREIVAMAAREFDIAPETLAHRRALEDLVRAVLVKKRPQLTAYFEGWRAHVVGERLLAQLRTVTHG